MKANSDKSFRKQLRSRSLSERARAKLDLRATIFIAAFSFSCATHGETAAAPAKAKASPAPVSASTQGAAEKSEETFQDLIQKAQNLTLQQDRLQASQVLIRGIQRESRNSAPYKELVKALEELSSVFYTEKAQNLFATAESLVAQKPREAIDSYFEAYKAEDRNVTILKALARAHLRLDECDKADARVKIGEEVNPYSEEIRLLRLQTLACQKNFEMLSTRLSARDADSDSTEKFVRGLQVLDLLRRKETKKAKGLLVAWEAQAPDYPEVHYWKWRFGKETLTPDRAAAAKYVHLCQNLTARKRKSFSLDVDLCKGKEAAEAFLKEKEAAPRAGEDAQ